MSPSRRAPWAAPATLAALILVAGCSLNPRLRLDAIAGLDGPVELVDVPFHSQEANHCGPASLLTLLEHSGVVPDYDTLASRVYAPGLEGSLQVEMLAAARGLGRIAYSLPPEPAAVLAEVTAGRPVLVLLNLGLPSSPRWHYAVVVGFDPARNRVVLRSGATARASQKAPAWLRRWDWGGRWAMVLLRPGEWPATPRRENLLQALAAFEDAAGPVPAGRAWETAVQKWPEEPIGWLGVGNAAFRRREWPVARAAYRRVLALDPERQAARLNLALSLDEEGRACDALTEVLPPPAEPHHPLRSAFQELEGRLREACEATRDSATEPLPAPGGTSSPNRP